MSDTFDAVYAAVSNKIAHCNTEAVIERVLYERIDFSRAQARVQEAISELERPSVLFCPRLSLDGNAWCAVYGPDIQEGVCGFGDSPAEAMANFDHAWYTKVGKADA